MELDPTEMRERGEDSEQGKFGPLESRSRSESVESDSTSDSESTSGSSDSSSESSDSSSESDSDSSSSSSGSSSSSSSSSSPRADSDSDYEFTCSGWLVDIYHVFCPPRPKRRYIEVTDTDSSDDEDKDKENTGHEQAGDEEREYKYEYKEDKELGFDERVWRKKMDNNLTEYIKKRMRDEFTPVPNKVPGDKRRVLPFDIPTRYFRSKCQLLQELKSYKLPKSKTDSVELEPLPGEVLPSSLSYKPILHQTLSKDGRLGEVVQRVVGFRELFDKRRIIQSMREQDEILEDILRPQKPVQSTHRTSLQRQNFFGNQTQSPGPVFEFEDFHDPIYELIDVDEEEDDVPTAQVDEVQVREETKDKLEEVEEIGTKIFEVGQVYNRIAVGGKIPNTEKGKTAGKGKTRKSSKSSGSTKSKVASGLKTGKSILKGGANAGKTVQKVAQTEKKIGKEQKSANTGKKVSTGTKQANPKEPVGTSSKSGPSTATGSTSKRKKSRKPPVPSHIVQKKTIAPKPLKRQSSNLSTNSKRTSVDGTIKTDPAGGLTPKSTKKVSPASLFVKDDTVVNAIPPGFEDRLPPPPPTPKASTKAKEAPVQKSTKEKRDSKKAKDRGGPKTVTFAEKKPDKSKKDKKGGRKSQTKHKHLHARELRLTLEEIDAMRKLELHLERDAEWLELSESDHEEEEKLRSQTIGKEKFRWMKPELSYESQLINRELETFTKTMAYTGRQPVHSKNDIQLGLVQYLIDRRKQIPFGTSSLFLWITSVFMLQGYVDISISSTSTAATDNYTAVVEKIELEKYRVGIFLFLANLFLVSIWSITVLLKDGLFICQYLNSLVASLTEMEVSGAVGIAKMARINFGIVLAYTFILSIAFIYDWPRTVRGTSGLISMLFFRTYVQDIRVKEDLIYFQIFGFILHLYVIHSSRGILTFMQLLASNLGQAAEKWNFKFGVRFGQFGLRSQGNLYKLKLNQSLIKLFIHHRYVIGLTGLYGRVFAVPIATYFILLLTVFTYYLIYLYRYKEGKPEDFAKLGGENYTYTTVTVINHDNITTSVINIPNYNTKTEDYLTLFMSLSHVLFDFIYTSETLAKAGTTVITGFEFVRRRGQILCDGSHERRLIQSLQWSFSAASPAVINVNQYFAVNRPSIIGGIGIALVMFSLIIQLNQDKTVLMIRNETCRDSIGYCYVTRRVPPPQQIQIGTTTTTTTTSPLENKQEYPYKKFFWFWDICFLPPIVDTMEAGFNFNFTHKYNLPVCFKEFHKDEWMAVNETGNYSKYFVDEVQFEEMKMMWRLRMNGSLVNVSDVSCKSKDWKGRLRDNFHTCYSKREGRYLLIPDVYVCPEPGCPLVWLRGLRNNPDCSFNPYPISPFFTNEPLVSMTPTTPILSSTKSPTTSNMSSMESPTTSVMQNFSTTDSTTASTTGAPRTTRDVHFYNPNTPIPPGGRRLGYFDCFGNEIDTINGRDDCGWIRLPRLHENDIPKLVNLIPEKIIPIPEGGGVSNLNTSKSCYDHYLEKCQNKTFRKFCPWANYDTRGYDVFTPGFYYGSDCFNASLFFDFVPPENFTGICHHEAIPKLLIDTDKDGRFHSMAEEKVARDKWNLTRHPTFQCHNSSGRKTECPTLYLEKEVEFPCQAKYAEGRSGPRDMNAFAQARDFRRYCRDKTNVIKGMVDILFRRNNQTRGVYYYDFESMRGLASCWDNAYPFTDPPPPKYTYHDCWGNQIELDDCNNINIPVYVGPFYRDNRAQIETAHFKVNPISKRAPVLINIEIDHHYFMSREKAVVPRYCWNTSFALARCSDPKIRCKTDMEEIVQVAGYGETCSNLYGGVPHNEFGACIRYLPKLLIRGSRNMILTVDNTFYHAVDYYNNTHKKTWLVPKANFTTEGNNCSKPTSGPDWTCQDPVMSFVDFQSKGKTNYKNFPCTEARNDPNCRTKNCTRINALVEALNFRIPCRDRNGIVRAMIPRLLSRMNDLNRPTEYWNIYTTPLEKYREDKNLNCWENPFVLPGSSRPLWDLDSLKSDDVVHNCWGDVMTNTSETLDDCGWLAFDKFATGFQKDLSKVGLVSITVDINENGIIRRVSRNCWDTDIGRERCADTKIRCANESGPIQEKQLVLYGQDCLDYGLTKMEMDEYGACYVQLPGGLVDNIIYFPPNYYNTIKEINWKPGGFYSSKCSQGTTGGRLCDNAPGFFNDFVLNDAMMDGPCTHARKLANCKDGKKCQEMNALIEALNFRMPCRNQNSEVIAMIPRLMFRRRVPGATHFKLESVPLDQYWKMNKLSCWESPYLNSTNFRIQKSFWEDVDDVYTCWSSKPITTSAYELDDCGWLPMDEYASGRNENPLMKYQKIQMDFPATSLYNATTRICWNDPIGMMRCNDRSIVCKTDNAGTEAMQVIGYGHECSKYSPKIASMRDDFGVCSLELPAKMVNNVTLFTRAWYTELSRIWKPPPSGGYGFRSNSSDFKCKMCGPSYFPVQSLPFPCVHRKNACTSASCTLINPFIEATSFRILCKDRNNKVRGTIPRLLWPIYYPSIQPENINYEIPDFIRGYLGDNSKNGGPVNCWENPFITISSSSPSGNQSKWRRPSVRPGSLFNSEASVHNCWGQGFNKDSLDDCGNIPFEEFATGTEVSLESFKKVIIKRPRGSGGAGEVNVRCWDTKFAKDRCKDPEINCTYDDSYKNQGNVFLYGQDCLDLSLKPNEYGVCNASLPLTLLDLLKYFPEGYDGLFSISWANTSTSSYRSDPSDKRCQTSFCINRDSFFNTEGLPGTNPSNTTDQGFPCQQRRDECRSRAPGRCYVINSMIEATSFRLPCRDKRGVIRAMIPRHLWNYKDYLNEIPKADFAMYPRTFIVVDLDQIRTSIATENKLAKLSCWETPFGHRVGTGSNLHFQAFSELYNFTQQKPQVYHPNSTLGFYNCWGTNFDTSLLDDCGWISSGKYATGNRPTVLDASVSKVAVPVIKNGKRTVRMCHNDPEAIERCKDTSLACNGDP